MRTDTIYTLTDIDKENATMHILNSRAKDLNYRNFYHYTTVDAVKKILTKDANGNRFFFVRNMGEMNDRNEAELHKAESGTIHSFCTCSTRHEKIPLWYLYSGICGNGARIGFTSANMLKFLNSIDTVYPVVDDHVDYSSPLVKGKEYEFMCGWVQYLMEGNTCVLFRNELYRIQPPTKTELKANYFIKDYPWEYEREFRIVIKNKTEKQYEKVAIPLPDDIVSTLEITSAPEITFSAKQKREFCALGIHEKKLKESRLGIKMDLLRNNHKVIMENLREWCTEQELSNLCGFLCEKDLCCKKGEGKK